MLRVVASCDWRKFMLPIENDHLPEKMPIADASADDRRQRDSDAAKLRSDGVQGEGNYDAARNFNSAERRFIAQGKVPAAARAAAPRSAAEQQEMLAAELAGKRRAKKDPEARKTGTLTLDKRG
jgi:hypothetical protein